MTTTSTKEEVKKTVEEPVKLKGKYFSAIGRRKTAIARVRLYKKGTGALLVNDMKAEEYFAADTVKVIKQPLKLTGNLKDFTVSAICRGGGKIGQAIAIRHGISRALVEMDEELKAGLKAKGWMTRDARRKERKKPGLKKARRAPQWSKR
jgi:small subunit ribosomal protein S9